MLGNGFIVIHRKITDWGWYKDNNTFKLFIHLILTANYEKREFMGHVIERGQRVASYETLAKETGLSVKNVRTAIKHLKATNEVASQSTPNYTVFTVVKYADYQDRRQTNGQTGGKQGANDGQTGGNNETKINKDKQGNNIIMSQKTNVRTADPAPARETGGAGGWSGGGTIIEPRGH